MERMLKQAKKPCSQRLLLLSLALAATTAWGDWRLSPTLSVMGRYSDNIDLDTTGGQSAFLTEIRPGLSLTGKGGRANYQVDYGLQALVFSHDSDENALNHQLSANLRTELLEDSFFLDAGAHISQRNADQTLPSGTGNYNTTGNSLETRSLSLTPSWRSRFGNMAKLDARWQFSLADTDGATISNTAGNNLNIQLSSGTAFNRLPWSLGYQQQNSNGDASAKRVSSLHGTLGYLISRKTQVNATLGQDSNDGNTAGFQQNGGSYWNLGMSWNPSPRTRLAATLGKRFNGNSYSLDFGHRTRRSAWSLRYSEQVVDTFALISNSVSYVGYMCGVSVIMVPEGSVPSDTSCVLIPGLVVPISVPSLQDGFNLTKTWVGTTSYNTGKSTFSLSLSDNRLDALAAALSSNTTSLSGSWNWRLNSRLTSTLTLSSSQSDYAGSESEDWNLSWMLSRKLAKDATGVLEARHLDRSDKSTTGGYSENSLSARVNLSF